MLGQGVSIHICDYNRFYEVFKRNMHQEVGPVKERQIVFQFNTALDHFQEQFKLGGIYKVFIKDKTKKFMAYSNIVLGHIHK